MPGHVLGNVISVNRQNINTRVVRVCVEVGDTRMMVKRSKCSGGGCLVLECFIREPLCQQGAQQTMDPP